MTFRGWMTWRHWLASAAAVVAGTVAGVAAQATAPDPTSRIVLAVVVPALVVVPLLVGLVMLADRAVDRRRHPAMPVTGPARWIRSTSGREPTEIGVEAPCDGSPRCAGAVHLRSLDLAGCWHQLHLSIGEMRRLRALIDGCVTSYERAGRRG